MDSAQNSDLTPIFSDLNQSENLSEVKPPLGTQTTPPSTLGTQPPPLSPSTPRRPLPPPHMPPSCNSDTGGHRVHERDLKSHCLCAAQWFKKSKICQKIDSIHFSWCDITSFSKQLSKLSFLVEICQNWFRLTMICLFLAGFCTLGLTVGRRAV